MPRRHDDRAGHGTRDQVRFLYKASKPYHPLFALFVACSMLASGLDGVSVGMLAPLLRELQEMGMPDATSSPIAPVVRMLGHVSDDRRIALMIGLIIVAVAAKNATLAAAMRLGHWLSSRLVADLRARAARTLLGAGVEYHDRSKAGDLIEYSINSTAYLENFTRTFLEFTSNVLTLVTLVALLFMLSWPLALLAVALGSACVLLGLLYLGRLLVISRRASVADRSLLTAMHEALGAIRLIKSCSTERRHVSVLERAVDESRRARAARNFWNYMIHPITDVAATSTLALLFGAMMLLHAGNTKAMLADFLPFTFVLLRIVPLAKILNGQKGEIVNGWPYFSDVYTLLRDDDKRSPEDGHRPFPGLAREIRFEGVAFTYRGRRRPALDGVSFAIPAGKTTAIVGESGAGKSTVAHLLLRHYEPQAGEILIDGVPLSGFQVATYHERVGVVSQDIFLFNDTVRYNIAYGGGEVPPDDDAVVAAARQACAHEFIMKLPQGYDTQIGDRGVQLSGGQRQRLAIARAILRQPEILILDEATSMLDPETEREIQDTLDDLSRDRTVVVIAHRPSTIEGADRVIVLKEGRVVDVARATHRHDGASGPHAPNPFSLI